MINKKGFQTRDFLIAGLLFTAVIIFFVIGIADMQQNYPNNQNIVSQTFADNYNKLTEQTASLALMKNTSLSGEGLSFRGAFDVTFGSFFTIMQLTFSTLNLFGGMYGSIATDFPFVDSLVLNNFMILGLAMITIILIFKLINAVGRNPV
jgi:hypothetical protein